MKPGNEITVTVLRIFKFFCKGLSLLKIIHRTSFICEWKSNKANNIRPISIWCLTNLFEDPGWIKTLLKTNLYFCSVCSFCCSVATLHRVLLQNVYVIPKVNSSRLLRMFFLKVAFKLNIQNLWRLSSFASAEAWLGQSLNGCCLYLYDLKVRENH